MIRTIILDLDGPVLDIKHRHYACYSQILKGEHCVPLKIKDYWQMKRQGVGWPQILAATNAISIQGLFERGWNQLIETKEFLALDQVQLGCIEKLEEWAKQQIRLILVTMRHSPERLQDQLVEIGLRDYFNQVVVVSNGSHGSMSSKARMVEPFIGNQKEGILWIGDTEEDIQAARELQCLVYVVTCGIRDKSFLKQRHPDSIISNLKSVNLEGVFAEK